MASKGIQKCFNCGKEFDDKAGIGFCLPCDIAIAAVEAPQSLKDMRYVYEGHQPGNPPQKLLKALLDKDPNKFLDRLEKAEAEYKSRFVPNGTDGPDGGQDKADELIGQLLEEANEQGRRVEKESAAR